MSDTPDILNEIAAADAGYEPIAGFSSWSQLFVDSQRWEKYVALLTRRKQVDADILRKARAIVKRAAAVETGAIEELYEVDRGFTFTVATEAAMWQAAVQARGTAASALIESQLSAYDFVLDFATQNTPIAEAWIRQLHQQICRGQDEYTVYTQAGPQRHKLPLAEYKRYPNHVKTPDGKVHSYAPVGTTSSEMNRLCSEFQTELFGSSHPVLQAAYSHYCLTAIHPFADGNGRVARALASVFTYRSQSVPLLILAEHRKEYFECLSEADKSSFQPLVDFVFERTLDAIQLVDESLRAAERPSLADSVGGLRKLFTTSGGYTHAEIDRAAELLANLIIEELNSAAAKHNVPNQFLISTGTSHGRQYEPSDKSYRYPLSNSPTGVDVALSASEPAQAQINRTYRLHVPIDCGKNDDIILIDAHSSEEFRGRITELLPGPTASIRMRARIWIEGVLADAITKLQSMAEEGLKKRGYRV